MNAEQCLHVSNLSSFGALENDDADQAAVQESIGECIFTHRL